MKYVATRLSWNKCDKRVYFQTICLCEKCSKSDVCCKTITKGILKEILFVAYTDVSLMKNMQL